MQAQHYITQLKSQINSLEAELEEQRAQKQRALVENEQLRMELEATRHRSLEHESLQSTFLEAESEATTTNPSNSPAIAAALTTGLSSSSCSSVQSGPSPQSRGTTS